MDIGISRGGRPLLPAALALVLLGASLVFLTWRNLEGQRELVENHARLSARGTLRSVQASVTRGVMRARPETQAEFKALIEEFFKEMTASREAALLGIYDETGRPLIFSGLEAAQSLELPPEALETLEAEGEWFDTRTIGDKTLVLYATSARPELEPDPRGPFFPFSPPPPPEFLPGRPPGHGPPPGPPHEPPPLSGPPRKPGLSPFPHGLDLQRLPSFQTPLLPPMPPQFGQHLTLEPPAPRSRPYILLGLDFHEYEGPYLDVRRAAILQAGYVLVVAAFSLILAVAASRRREQNTRLLRLESFHSRLLDNMPDGLVTLDAAGRITAFNPAAQDLLSRLTGRKAQDIMGAAWEDIAPMAGREDAPMAMSAPDESWRLLEREGLSLELRGVPVEAAQPQSPADRPEKLILLRDRSRIRRLERDLAEATKLAAIGRLAAGVAHEIRNPLSSLRGFAQFFASKLKGREPEETYAKTMVHEADRLNRVVADLLFLARPRQLSPEPVNLAELAAELAQILRFDIEHKHADLRTDLAAATVTADPDALRQVLINLILNSLAALPDQGGTITLASAAAPPGRVTLTVLDNGCGIEPDELQKVLEPFHTTKKHGSGLGLAIVHKIMREHDGALSVTSLPGQGTRVELEFPGA
jgi:two-component system sensor histidine kinase HydH